MWDRRKLLLAAIILTALYYKVTAKSAKLLDMAPDVVDDMYIGCREEAMEKFIHSGLLRQELNRSEGFQKAWNTNTQCSKLIPGGIKEHTAALLAFVNGDTDFRNTFDNAVETLGVNVSVYEDHFHFKSLHFLLMDSMTLLKPKECKSLYVLPERKHTAKKGTEVRFGGFTTAHSSFSVLKRWEDLEGQVIFNITSCFFAILGDNICGDEKDMALLSPAEVFTVEEVHTKTDADDFDYTEIVLKTSRLDSSHNCYMFSRSPTGVSTQIKPEATLVLVALSLFFFNC
ncbi:ecto-ADP-ribosyltransferase 5 [Enoplosus armatus]|uniref:ecto-ADP-ribosyltransferase 5 n=1 Tax=Enoplosus armatus TaxID=215367 RepID=UPI00399386A3